MDSHGVDCLILFGLKLCPQILNRNQKLNSKKSKKNSHIRSRCDSGMEQGRRRVHYFPQFPTNK